MKQQAPTESLPRNDEAAHPIAISPHFARRELLATVSMLTIGEILPLKAMAHGYSLHGNTSSRGTAPTLAQPLMKPDLENALDTKCRIKPVLAEQIIDDMETSGRWIASSGVDLSTTTENARAGTRALRFRVRTRDENYIQSARAPNGSFTGRDILFAGTPFSAFATLRFSTPQDWSGFNRISMWCYLHPTTHPLTTISMQFLCEGANAGPSDPIAIHYIGDLVSGAWTLLTWEISEYTRDKVREFVLFKPTSGVPLQGADDWLTYDFDQLKVERVNVERPSGWEVSPHKIAYSHVGYQPHSPKVAICAEADTQTFVLLDEITGTAVATLPTRQITTRRGRFALLDFTAFSVPGRYRLSYGGTKSDAFPIEYKLWDRLIDTTLNAYQGFRCGCAVPDLHDACHLDTFVEYQGERRVAGGGWHDAANLTQFGDLTHLSIIALLKLHEQLAQVPGQERRAKAVLEEACWGLDWALRMRFGPGLRQNKTHQGYWTNGIVGDSDDVIENAVERSLRDNIFATAALAVAARSLKAVDPKRALIALKAAHEDYANLLSEVKVPLQETSLGDGGRGTWRDLVAYLTLAATELYCATGATTYRDDAIRFGDWLLELQEIRFIDGSPVTGYFYADAAKSEIQREVFGSCDDAGLLALQSLCEAFPDHKRWIKWYAGLLIYSEYYCSEGAAASAPFDIIPAAVWRKQDFAVKVPIDKTGEALAQHASPIFPTRPTEALIRAQSAKMFEAGVALNSDTRLRVFPLWNNHVQHGSSTAHLTRTIGLSCAAKVRGNLALAHLAERQMQWLLGANPFSRSLIYGVGYDFWQNFTGSLTNFVGGMGMGMNSYEDDAPAWPNNAVFPYKEQWVYSSNRLALNLAFMVAPARIKGTAKSSVQLQNLLTGENWKIAPGRFNKVLTPGRYSASCSRFTWQLELAPGEVVDFTFDPERAIDVVLTQHADGHEGLRLRASLRGTGRHDLTLRLFNCETPEPNRSVILEKGEVTLEWHLRVIDREKPWIAIVGTRDNCTQYCEAYGRLGSFPLILDQSMTVVSGFCRKEWPRPRSAL